MGQECVPTGQEASAPGCRGKTTLLPTSGVVEEHKVLVRRLHVPVQHKTDAPYHVGLPHLLELEKVASQVEVWSYPEVGLIEVDEEEYCGRSHSPGPRTHA
jgi:hypothetical protein